MFNTPILLIIFNRPDLTEQVFAAIRKAKPAKLFVAADGPRNQQEKILTDAARKATELIDWPCEVMRVYAAQNMGCRKRVSTGITWFFEEVEEGIILEDDCLPNSDFFSFCESMLSRYRSNEKIMSISGDCFLEAPISESYYFTNYTHIWGWATWRRSWKLYDLNMPDWGTLNQHSFLQTRLKTKYAVDYWQKCFDGANSDSFNNWDYQWTFAMWKFGGLAIAPAVNLISNIGFRKDATHTLNPESFMANKPLNELKVLKHPQRVEVNKEADEWVRDNIYSPPKKSTLQMIIKKLIRWAQ